MARRAWSSAATQPHSLCDAPPIEGEDAIGVTIVLAVCGSGGERPIEYSGQLCEPSVAALAGNERKCDGRA
jgi:hypothetical protein